jgi:uncharacterized lipoprotein YmbA
MHGPLFGSVVLSLSLGVLAAGCAKGPPPTFYILDATASDALVGVERGVSVGVEPIELPAHLNRPQIVTRATDHRLALSEFNQWAEPLKNSISRVIAINLSNSLESNRIFVIPRRKRATYDFQVSIDIARFDGELGEGAVLGARWTISGKDGREPLLTQVTMVYEKAEGSGYDALVAAQSRCLERMSQEIAEAITTRM